MEIYGADGCDYSEEAEKKIEDFTRLGFTELPICMAKTHLSFTSNPKLKGAWGHKLSSPSFSLALPAAAAAAAILRPRPPLAFRPFSLWLSLPWSKTGRLFRPQARQRASGSQSATCAHRSAPASSSRWSARCARCRASRHARASTTSTSTPTRTRLSAFSNSVSACSRQLLQPSAAPAWTLGLGGVRVRV